MRQIGDGTVEPEVNAGDWRMLECGEVGGEFRSQIGRERGNPSKGSALT